MKKNISIIFSILLYLFSVNYSLCENNGQISGYIIDGNSGEKIPGANIIIVDTQFGATSDSSGKYKISSINAGNYTIQCLIIGYRTIIVDSVLVQKNKSTEITFVLSPTLIKGETTTSLMYRPDAKMKSKFSSMDPDFAIITSDSMDPKMIIAADPSVDPGIFINPKKFNFNEYPRDSLKLQKKMVKPKAK